MKMNREIKFRAWQKYHKKMVEVTSISFDDNGEINGVATFVENQAPQHISYRGDLSGRFFLKDERGMVLELMQYTGLKDRNGVEIYEGDVVQSTWYNINNNHYKKKGEIIFVGAQYVIAYDSQFDVETGEITYDAHSLTYAEDVEVIGNIYEHNHLLG